MSYCPRCADLERALSDCDRILRSSVPDRYKGATSAIGGAQSYIAELEAYAEALRAPAAELLALYDWRPELAKREKDHAAQIGFGNDDEAAWRAEGKELKRLLREYGERKKAGWIALRAALNRESEIDSTSSDQEGQQATPKGDQRGTTPTPSCAGHAVGIKLPPLRDESADQPYESSLNAEGWNACLEEVVRLNPVLSQCLPHADTARLDWIESYRGLHADMMDALWEAGCRFSIGSGMTLRRAIDDAMKEGHAQGTKHD